MLLFRCGRIDRRQEMGEVQIDHHAEATSVVLVAWRGDIWLWFTVEPGRQLPQFFAASEIEDALRDSPRDVPAKSLIETSMHAAGYQLRPTAIQSEDLAVWEIVT